MKKLLCGIAVVLLGLPVLDANAQIYVKLNGVYALAGVVNPAVEIPLSRRSTFQSEIVYSPWESVTIKNISGPMKFGIFMNEYRRYFKERNNGWYLAGNAGVSVYNLTKPTLRHGIRLTPKSSKGYGFIFGIAGGYEWRFKEKWLIDIFFGWSFMSNFYNGYSLIDGLVEGGKVYNKGELILTPQGHEDYKHPDPFNGSAEWMPNKGGISIGLIIFDPKKAEVRRNRRMQD